MTKREPTAVRRRQIADAALRLIAVDGVGAFTTSAIAREVGITEGAIFRHFATKEEIVLAAIERIEELFAQGEEGLREQRDPIDRLRSFVEHRVRVVEDNDGIPRLIFSDELAIAAGEAGVARVRAIRERAAATIRSYLEEARRAGRLAPGLNVDATALLVQGALMVQVLGRAPGSARARVWATLERLLTP